MSTSGIIKFFVLLVVGPVCTIIKQAGSPSHNGLFGYGTSYKHKSHLWFVVIILYMLVDAVAVGSKVGGMLTLV